MSAPQAFLVTTGEYSAYEVVAVCLDEAEAVALAEWLGNTGGYGDGHHEVEEIDLGDGWRANKTEVLSIHAQLNDSDKVDYREKYKRWVGVPDSYHGPCKVHIKATTYTGPYVQVTVEGTDHQRVRKVLSEQVAQAKADYAILIEAERLRQAERDAKYEQWKLDNPQGFLTTESSQSYYPGPAV